MKTQTAEEILRKKINESLPQEYNLKFYETALSAMHDHTTTQIEVLRERLMKNAPSVLAGISIERTINEFLKEINYGKNIN